MARKKTAQVLSTRTIYKGKIFSVVADSIVEPSGAKVERETIRHQGSVVIMGVDDSGREPKVLLAKQYRFPADRFLWELPAGRIDPGETPLAGAKRELMEETGFTARTWKKALFFYASPGFLDETMTIYMARDLKAGDTNFDEDEDIEARFFPLSKAVQMALTGKIPDGKTITALLWLERELRSRKRAG